MAVEDTPPPPPPFQPIKSSFLVSLTSLGLKSYVETDSASTNPEWCQLDDLIKMWNLGSLCDSLQEQVVTTPGNAKALWDHLKNLFHDNKDARAINLDNELRSIKIGKMTVNEYCTKIQAMANRLKNLDSEISEKNIMMFAVNGLDSRFATLAEIIRHREPLPTFETNNSSANSHVRPVALTAQLWPIHYHSGPAGFTTPSAYVMAHSPHSYLAQPPNVVQYQPHPVQAHQPQPASYQATTYSAQQQPVYSGQHGILSLAPVNYPSQPTSILSAFSTMTLQDPSWNIDTGASSHLNSSASNLSTIFNQRLFPSVHVGDGALIPVTNTEHSIIPSSHRPLHLHNVLVTPNIIKNLISVRQFTRDNNCTIEFDAFGFSVKDFLTRHILLRCDSSGDLYPVTKPSTLPTAFVSTSSSTWHQRLGHPGDEVLRSLVSRHFISCNKEKSTHVCHACQLGKHVKLPFHSSNSVVKHCFDIIHSDLWTSSIVSSTHFHLPTDGLTNSPTPARSNTVPSQQAPLPQPNPTHPQQQPAPRDPHRTHHMVTRSQLGVVKPIDCLSLDTSSISPLTKNPFDALKDPQWRHAMYDEYNALVKNGTWLLVPRPARVNMVRSMWLFKHKFHADGTLSRYKACLVANGSSEKPGKWPIYQLDVKNAFLNGDLSETVYMHQPPNFVDARFPNQGSKVAYLLLYVDGIILTASSTTLLQQLIGSLHREFDMTDIGELNYFLGISIVRHSTGLFLSQKKYAFQLLEHAHMVNCNPSRTPVDTESKLGPDGVPVQDPTLYRSLARGLYVEAEYQGVANIMVETTWLRNLLRELHSLLFTATLIYFIAGIVKVLHVPSRFLYADIFTKELPSALFEEFCSSLSVWPPIAPTARAY
ncbi:ribonuclease H-like domain-containing protein [Tanacetum coccineum]